MVIEYSVTVNLFTSLDVNPFSKIENLLNNDSENHLFSKIDLSSACHQVTLNKKVKQVTAFEVSGSLQEINRLLFWETNTLPAFLRIIDIFVDRNKLEKT